ncbi:MAG: rhomboid family intramembrane serine protease [Prolixibacteraceae bacterium]|nr:rhomboid family intramembrane serine protease [Prolixibacteraceae bacterium]MBN2772934.1 rhomboid family intramembrane serine protease [Prolixibacteraceae bacterium]
MALFRYYPENYKENDKVLEKKILVHSLVFASAFVFLFWFVKIIEHVFELDFVTFGVYPLHLKGLKGILFSPFIHANFNHLMANSVPFFILTTALIYYYRRISYRIFFLIYIISGICVWVGGRQAWHIGASGVVYGLAAFHFVSGILRNDLRLLTMSIIVVFLYGSMIWGIFPLKPEISWEAHLWGGVSGVILAFYYRRFIVKRKKFDWEDEPEEDEDSTKPIESYFKDPTFSSDYDENANDENQQ